MRGTRFALATRISWTLLAALILSLSTNRDAGASTTSDRATDRILLPFAGWNGRPIQAPHRHETVRTGASGARLRGWSAGGVGYGAGFHRPGGSDRVREVQRRLASLGYRVGPVDGLFGRRTRASVAWFQVKHGLPVDGRATPVTVRHLRTRTTRPSSATRRAGERPRAAAPGEMAVSHAPAWEAYRQLVGERVVVPGGRGADPTRPATRWVLIALAAVDVLLLIALLWQRRALGAPAPSLDSARTATSAPDETPAPLAAPAERPTRRFVPPVGLREERPPGAAPGRSREGRS
jgi:hypothetical protein